MPIRVLLVEDSQIALVILRRILDSSPHIEVVGTARTGIEALALIPQVQPDVICTDLHMPQMDGLEFTSQVMARYPRPILVISVSVQEEDTQQVFQLLEAGAVDIFPKPHAGLIADDTALKQALIHKIQVLAGVKVFTKRQKDAPKRPEIRSSAVSYALYPRPKIVVIGASTGGPQSLYEIFANLPSDFPTPIVCVQHISFGFLQGFIDWLGKSCRLPIQVAQAGDVPQAGRIYFPPEQQHLELDTRGRFVYSNAPPVNGHRPSVNVTLESAAKSYGRATIGILLTGMGNDGAAGMQAIAQAGGLTIAQNEATSVVFGMPKEAIALGAVKHVLPIQAIAPTLLTLVKKPFPEFTAQQSHSITKTF